MSLVDGLLVKTWSPSPRWSPELTAPYLTEVWRRVEVVLAVAQDPHAVRALTIELEDATIVLQEVWPDYAGVFVFPAATSLGLARLAIRHEMPRLREAIWQLEPGD